MPDVQTLRRSHIIVQTTPRFRGVLEFVEYTSGVPRMIGRMSLLG